MQLIELRDHVQDLIQDSAEDVFSSTQVDRWLNRAARHLIRIIREHAPEEFTKVDTFNTVSGTREYNLLTAMTAQGDFGDLHRVERSSTTDTSRPRPMIVDRAYNRGRRDIDDERVYLRNTTLGFYVAPTSVFTVHVHYAPVFQHNTDLQAVTDDLVSLTGIPRVRDEFQDALIYRTAYLLLLSENGNWQPLKQEASEFEVRMVKSLRRRVRGPKFINVIPRHRAQRDISGVTGRR
jgi:hypothetical protein